MAAYEEPVQVHMPIGHCADLCRFRPDVVISAEFGFRSLIATAYAGFFRAKFLLAWRPPATRTGTARRADAAPPFPRHHLHGCLCNGREYGVTFEGFGRAAARHFRDRPGP